MRQRLRKLRYQTIYAIIFAVFWCISAVFAHADSIDSRAYVEKAVELIQAEQWSLARTYLAPALIDPRLGAGERSRAYYLQGYSYYAQGLPVSASKDYARALEFNPENGAALVSLWPLLSSTAPRKPAIRKVISSSATLCWKVSE
jgi:Tfp pilus assembly protein PilF